MHSSFDDTRMRMSSREECIESPVHETLGNAWRNAWRDLVTSVKMRGEAEAEWENEVVIQKAPPSGESAD